MLILLGYTPNRYNYFKMTEQAIKLRHVFKWFTSIAQGHAASLKEYVPNKTLRVQNEGGFMYHHDKQRMDLLLPPHHEHTFKQLMQDMRMECEYLKVGQGTKGSYIALWCRIPTTKELYDYILALP